MFYQNFVIIEGRICQDVDIKTTSSGHKYCRFTLCYNKVKKIKAEGSNEVKWESGPNYYNVVAWDKKAESCLKIAKGDAVSVIGQLDYSSWQDISGNNRNSVTIIANAVRRLYVESKKTTKDEDIPFGDEPVPEFTESDDEPDFITFPN